MSRIWRTLKGYLFWTYDRGSFHYDVMVTLILAFIFLAPRFVNFKDRPAEGQGERKAEIVVTPDGKQGFIYQVDAAEVDAQDMAMVRNNFQNVLRPIAGAIAIDRVEPVRDNAGRIVAYRAWVKK
jgi:hypothetical protein